jgi:alkylation response protein AidB-like acyl-CoA dehydrogenase
MDDLRDELRASAREVLAVGSDWPRLVDAGWTGLEVPDDLGGAGVTFAETAVVLTELGRAAGGSGYLGTALAIGALTALPADAARDALLERIASGARAALAAGFALHDDTVSGEAAFVADAADAEILLLLAGDTVVMASDLTITPRPVLDATRALADVGADRAPVTSAWRLPVDANRMAERAAVAIACDSLGVADAMLTATVDYVKVRHQFDRPIGSFQAVKHACADMLVRISVARQLVDAAVADVAAGTDASTSVAMAKSYACSAAVDVAGKAMQLHGGIGYTWESGVHVYLKRATLNRSLCGSPAAHRRTVAARYD